MKHIVHLFALFIILAQIPSSFSLFGVDFGSEHIKACYLGSGKNLFNIVENTSGKRKIANVVS